jgi:hypothetical protein
MEEVKKVSLLVEAVHQGEDEKRKKPSTSSRLLVDHWVEIATKPFKRFKGTCNSALLGAIKS